MEVQNEEDRVSEADEEFLKAMVGAAVNAAVTAAIRARAPEMAEAVAHGAAEGASLGAIRRPKAFRGYCTRCKTRGHLAKFCKDPAQGCEVKKEL